jgi:hypothetical protein
MMNVVNSSARSTVRHHGSREVSVLPTPFTLRSLYSISQSTIRKHASATSLVKITNCVPSSSVFRTHKNGCRNQIAKQRSALMSSSPSSTTSTAVTKSSTIAEENPFNMRRTSNVNEDDLPPITLDNTIRMKNAAMATVLMGFCFGIAYYSMHAVGQAGSSTSSTDTTSDPLAVLKAEAAIAQEKYDREQQATATTADMLQQFQKGEYDPDHVSDEELDNLLELTDKKKKPWWKFW